MNDTSNGPTLTGVVAALALVIAIIAVVLAGNAANAPVDLAASQLKFLQGISVTGSNATPPVVINAAATSVAPLRVLSAGTEVFKVNSAGAIIAASLSTPTP